MLIHLLQITAQEPALNVYGEPLMSCCTDPMTGWYRDGSCHTGPRDYGVHTVCAVMTEDFLSYTTSFGNDLRTPIPGSFPGLKPGDKWCLCASRWVEAMQAGHAPHVDLAATHIKTLEFVSIEQLQSYAVER